MKRLLLVLALPTRTYSITGFNLPNGSYEFAVTAYSATGESGASNIVPFVQGIPASPTNVRIQ
mgnify:CR=1 FL=1